MSKLLNWLAPIIALISFVAGFNFGADAMKRWQDAYYQGKQREVLEVGTLPAKACGGEDCIVKCPSCGSKVSLARDE